MVKSKATPLKIFRIWLVFIYHTVTFASKVYIISPRRVWALEKSDTNMSLHDNDTFNTGGTMSLEYGLHPTESK